MSTRTKPLAIDLPDHERGRSADDLKRLDILNRRLAKPLPKGNLKAEKDRARDLAERDALENRPHLAADAKWIRDANDESVSLAEGRGEEVERSKAGICRIIDRDPLLSLARTGKLSPEQMDVGLEVRELYESRSQDAKGAEFSGMPGTAHDHEKFIAARFTRAKCSEMIGRIERTIAINCSAEPACLTMLRVVCERGLSVTSQGKGRAFDRNVAALIRALDVADDVLRRRI